MINPLLASFHKDASVTIQSDYNEKIGNACLGVWHIGFGKQLRAVTFGKDNKGILFPEKIYSTTEKVSAAALCILGLPITLPLAGIGCIALLSSSSHDKMFEIYKSHISLCAKAKDPKNLPMPRALCGKTPVFLPEEKPDVILKMSGKEAAVSRFQQMEEIQEILTSQNSSHLIIPKTAPCEEFLIEERLPINDNSHHNMGLYISDPSLFDDAVREMTRLFSKIYLGDLVGSQNQQPLSHIEGIGDIVRHDNLPLFIEEKEGKKKGKIGLIDLESATMEPSPKNLEDLVRIFPYHLDLIKEEATLLKMEFDVDRLQQAASKGEKYYKVGYSDHSAWLKEKNISAENCFNPFEFPQNKMAILSDIIESELIKFNKGFEHLPYTPKNFLGENPSTRAKELAPQILDEITQNIENQVNTLRKNMLRKMNKGGMTEIEMVSSRAFILSREKICLAFVAKVLNFRAQIDIKEIADQLVCAVLKKLEGEDIFQYDPGYGTGGYENCFLSF